MVGLKVCVGVIYLKLGVNYSGVMRGTLLMLALSWPLVQSQTLLVLNTVLHYLQTTSLLCDYEEAFLKYTSDVQNPEDWDTLFVKAVVLSLASELANNLGAEAKVTGLIQELEQVVLPDAMTSNAWEDRSGVNNPTQDRIQQSVWTNQYNYTI